MKFFLTLKHWQLFVLILILNGWMYPSPWKDILNLAGIIMATGWMHAIVRLAYQRSNGSALHSKYYKRFCISAIGLLLLWLSLMFMQWFYPYGHYAIWALILVSAVATQIYICMIAGRMMKLLEKSFGKEIDERFGYGILFFFQMIGIWMIQPKINSMQAASVAEVAKY